MAIAGIAVGALIGVAFLLDLILGFPFGGRDWMMGIGFVACGAILSYLSWNALRDAK